MSNKLIGRGLRLFGLTGSNVVIIAAPRGFGRVVGGKQAGWEWWCGWIAEVKPLRDAGDHFLPLLQQGAYQRVCLSSSRPGGGAARRFGHRQILKSSKGVRDRSRRLVSIVGTRTIVLDLCWIRNTIEGRIQPFACFTRRKRGGRG